MLRSLSKYIDFICLLAIACFIGGSFNIVDNTAAIALWLAKALLSKINSASLPFSIAWTTNLWTELAGVIILFFLLFSLIAFTLQFLIQIPQPMQILSSIIAFLFSNLITSIGQTLAHLPHPTHFSICTSGKKIDVSIGWRETNFLIALSPSQQQLQQLHKKLILFLTFSPHWTTLFS